MKSNTNLFLTFAMSVLFFAYSCKPETPKKPVEDPIEEVDDEKKGKKRPRILLKYSELARILKQYDDTRKPVLMEQMGGKKEDARVQFISIKELKEYIRYIERQAKRKDIELTGINFISGAYPEDYKENPEHSDYQTLVMVPAMTLGDEKMVSIDLHKSKKGKPVTLRELLHKFYDYSWYYDGVDAAGIGTVNGVNLKSRKALVLSQGDEEPGDDLSSAGNRMIPSPPN